MDLHTRTSGLSGGGREGECSACCNSSTALGEGAPGSKNNPGILRQLGRQRHIQRGASGEEGPRVSSIFLPPPPAPTLGPATEAAENAF